MDDVGFLDIIGAHKESFATKNTIQCSQCPMHCKIRHGIQPAPFQKILTKVINKEGGPACPLTTTKHVMGTDVGGLRFCCCTWYDSGALGMVQ